MPPKSKLANAIRAGTSVEPFVLHRKLGGLGTEIGRNRDPDQDQYHQQPGYPHHPEQGATQRRIRGRVGGMVGRVFVQGFSAETDEPS